MSQSSRANIYSHQVCSWQFVWLFPNRKISGSYQLIDVFGDINERMQIRGTHAEHRWKDVGGGQKQQTCKEGNSGIDGTRRQHYTLLLSLNSWGVLQLKGRRDLLFVWRCLHPVWHADKNSLWLNSLVIWSSGWSYGPLLPIQSQRSTWTATHFFFSPRLCHCLIDKYIDNRRTYSRVTTRTFFFW